jgi:uncharacterized protein YbjT (DUF2867 family)
MTKVLVTGATGNVGSQVVRELRGRGVPVRAFVRDPDEAAATLGQEIELAVGEFSDPNSIRRALDGVEYVFLACGNHPRQVEYETNAIDAARAAGMRRIVKLSATGARIGSPLAFWDWHGRIEQHLRVSGLPAVILRPGFYMTNLLGSTEAIKHTGKLFAPADGARIAMIDPRDVAAAAAVVLTEDGHHGKTYTLTGPESITYDEVAGQLSKVTGRKIEFVNVPDGAAREALVQAGTPDRMAEQLVILFGLLRQGAAAQTTDEVRALTGREPRSFAEFARDFAHLLGR